MAKIYKKPVVSIDTGLSEGVYTASGASAGTLSVTYNGVWDRWPTGGKGLVLASWSGLSGIITLNVTFNDTIDHAETEPTSISCSLSGKTATFTFNANTTSTLTIGIHLNHGTSIDALKMTGYTYSVK